MFLNPVFTHDQVVLKIKGFNLKYFMALSVTFICDTLMYLMEQLLEVLE